MIIKAVLSVALAGFVASCARSPELPSADAPVSAYRCENGTRFTVVFNEDEAVVRLEGGRTFTLSERRSGSGFRYASRGVELRGSGREATFRTRQDPQTTCRAA